MYHPGSPKIFLSHSWNDNEHVRPLAEKLQGQGADVWFDQWEIGPGDSFVQKIDEGLSGCDAFLVVISAASVESRWVREELSAAIVRRIEDQTRLIPVRLDDSPVPTIIRHLRYVVLGPTEEAAREILKAVHGLNDKPPIGALPDYIQQGLARRDEAVPGLSPDATAVLREVVGRVRAQEHPFHSVVETADLQARLGLTATEFDDALDLLIARGAIKPLREYLGTLVFVKPRAWMYLMGELDFDLRRAMQTVAQVTVAHERIDGETIERETGLPLEQLRIAVGVLEEQQLVRVDLGGIGAGRPYGWIAVVAIRQTREWLKMQDL